MPPVTYFAQACPTCGRHLDIRLEYLGKKVVCQHCHGKFEASDAPMSDPTDSDRLMERAEELLTRADEQLATVRETEAATRSS